MQVLNRYIELQRIGFHPILWDSDQTNPEYCVSLFLDHGDLLYLGAEALTHATTCLNEEAAYFDDEPAWCVPRAPTLFIGDAALLAAFFRHGLWRSFMIERVMDRVECTQPPHGDAERDCYLVSFVNASASRHGIEAVFGCVARRA